MRWLWLAMLAMSIMPAPADAQQRGGAVPAAAAEAASNFLRALERGDWRAAASFLDSASMERNRQETLQWAEPRDVHVTTVEEIMRERPDVPRAVAEYFVKLEKEHPPRDFLSEEFADVTSPDTLRRMSIADAGARWLQAKDERYMMRRMLAETRQSCPPGLVAAATTDTVLNRFAPHFTVLGSFPGLMPADRAPQIVYVAYLPVTPLEQPDSAADRDLHRPRLLPLRQHGAEWKVVAAEDALRGTSVMLGHIECKADSAK